MARTASSGGKFPVLEAPSHTRNIGRTAREGEGGWGFFLCWEQIGSNIREIWEGAEPVSNTLFFFFVDVVVVARGESVRC